MKVTHVPAVEETKRIVIEPAKVVLELSTEEAIALTAILGQCSKDLTETLVPGLYMKMYEIVDPNGLAQLYKRIVGSIYFK
jgi:hypothetical protein